MVPSGAANRLGNSSLSCCKFVKKLADPAQDQRVARRTFKRFFGQPDQLLGVESCRNALEPHRAHLPIPVAARTLQQIDLTFDAFDKGLTQLKK